MMHNLEGMLILLRIKDSKNPERPIPPPGLPQCNSYTFKSDAYPWEIGNQNIVIVTKFESYRTREVI